jgi:hypothetical protein
LIATLRALGRHALAAFVAVHVAVVVISAIPSPEGGLSRKNWADPGVRVEMDAWADRLGMDHDTFVDRLWGFANAYQSALDVLLGPVERYERWTATGQSWKMFVAPHRQPARFSVEARDASGWRVLFREGDADATWMAWPLRMERLRASIVRWAWPSHAKPAKTACGALAARAFAEDPAIEEVRCRFWRARTPSARQVLDGRIPDGTWDPTFTVRR